MVQFYQIIVNHGNNDRDNLSFTKLMVFDDSIGLGFPCPKPKDVK